VICAPLYDCMHVCIYEMHLACLFRYFVLTFDRCSYGELDNTRLIQEYGFALPDNPFHCLIFSEDELKDAAASVLGEARSQARMQLCQTVLSTHALESDFELEDIECMEDLEAGNEDNTDDGTADRGGDGAEQQPAQGGDGADEEATPCQSSNASDASSDDNAEFVDDHSGVELQLFDKGFVGLALACSAFLLGVEDEAVSDLEDAEGAVAALMARLQQSKRSEGVWNPLWLAARNCPDAPERS
jgi:hypothetical protein